MNNLNLTAQDIEDIIFENNDNYRLVEEIKYLSRNKSLINYQVVIECLKDKSIYIGTIFIGDRNWTDVNNRVGIVDDFVPAVRREVMTYIYAPKL